MRKLLIATLLSAMVSGQAFAQDLKMRDVFKQMPDSLMPYLTQNNRLDFIDFLDSKMKAEVKNALGETSEMTTLADDSLSIRMSESLRTDLILLPLDQPIDSISQVVVMVDTYLSDSIYGDSRVRYFSPDWKPMLVKPELSENQKKRVASHVMQNIIKKDDEILNKY